MWCQVLLCVQRNFLLRLRLGMTDDTAPLQYVSHAWILGRVSFNCISQCTIDYFVSRCQPCGSRCVAFQQAFNPPPASFAVSLLSPLTISQVPAPRTSFTETPLFEVCTVKVSPRYFVLSISSAPGERGTISAGLSIPT